MLTAEVYAIAIKVTCNNTVKNSLLHNSRTAPPGRAFWDEGPACSFRHESAKGSGSVLGNKALEAPNTLVEAEEDAAT